MFNFVSIDPSLANRWDAILTLIGSNPTSPQYIVSDSLPAITPPLSTSLWAKRIGVADYAAQIGTGKLFADATAAGTALGVDLYYIRYTGRGYYLYTTIDPVIPAKVVVDELSVDPSLYVTYSTILTYAGNWLSGPAILPAMQNQWACAIQHIENASVPPAPPNPDYQDTNLYTALVYILLGGGYLVFEMYPTRYDYCEGSHDVYLRGYFQYDPSGTSTRSGFQWVWDTFTTYQSQMQVLFGVHDGMVCPFLGPVVNGPCDNTYSTGPEGFIDRMFYIWKNYLPPAAIGPDRGGPGSWKWDDNVGYVSGGSAYLGRDSQWAAVWNYYVPTMNNPLVHNGPQWSVWCPPDIG